jgi:hypothetical protein
MRKTTITSRISVEAINMRFSAIAILAVLSFASLALAKNKNNNPADYPLTAEVVSVTGPNTESASGVGTDSHGNSATAQVYSSTAARAEIQIEDTIYLVGLPHECNCIHRKHIDLSAGETLHAHFMKDNQRIAILRESSDKAVVETFDVKGSRVATEKKN